jgi:hypothetical protein
MGFRLSGPGYELLFALLKPYPVNAASKPRQAVPRLAVQSEEAWYAG